MDFPPSSSRTQTASVRYGSRRARRSNPSLKTVLSHLYICGRSYCCKQRNSPSRRNSRTFGNLRNHKKEQFKRPCCLPGVFFSKAIICFIYQPVRAHKVTLWSRYIMQSYIIMKLNQNLFQSVRVEHIESDPLSKTLYKLFLFVFSLSFASSSSSERSHDSCCSSSRPHVTKHPDVQLNGVSNVRKRHSFTSIIW